MPEKEIKKWAFDLLTDLKGQATAVTIESVIEAVYYQGKIDAFMESGRPLEAGKPSNN